MADGTLGHGGHARLILAEYPSLSIYYGLDQDISVYEWFQKNPLEDRLKLVHANFGEEGELPSELMDLDAVLLDLGTSQQQLRRGERGFSFLLNGPLDMRMDTTQGETLLDWLLRAQEREIFLVLKKYGEEPFAYQMARAVIRERGKLETTLDLARVLENAVPMKVRRNMKIHAATRAFQAFRIFINRELEVLEQALEIWLKRLRPGGHFLIISFHSLEDRLVKQTFKEWAEEEREEGLFGPGAILKPSLGRFLSRKAIMPSEEELLENPPSRSARLRVFQKRETDGSD